MNRIEILDALENSLYRLNNFRCLVDMLCGATNVVNVPADVLHSISELVEMICLKSQADINAIKAAEQSE